MLSLKILPSSFIPKQVRENNKKGGVWFCFRTPFLPSIIIEDARQTGMEIGFWSTKCGMGINMAQPWTEKTTYIFTLQNSILLSCMNGLMLCKTPLCHTPAVGIWGWLCVVPCFLVLAGLQGLGQLVQGCPPLPSSWIGSLGKKTCSCSWLNLTAVMDDYLLCRDAREEEASPVSRWPLLREKKNKNCPCSPQTVNGLKLQFRSWRVSLGL